MSASTPVSTGTLFPPILWAEHTAHVFITVVLQDAQHVKVELPDEGQVFDFACETVNGQAYACRLNLYEPVSAEESHFAVRSRQIEIKLKKRGADVAENGDENNTADPIDVEVNSWPRLTREKVKNANIQVDWQRWKDADEGTAETDVDNFGLPEDKDEGEWVNMVHELQKEKKAEALAAARSAKAANKTGAQDQRSSAYGDGTEESANSDGATAYHDDDGDDDMPALEDDTDN